MRSVDRSSRRAAFALGAGFGVAATLVWFGGAPPLWPAAAEDPRTTPDRAADAALALVRAKYVDPARAEAVVEAALRRAVGRLDGPSAWLSPDDVRRLEHLSAGHTTGLIPRVVTTDAGIASVRVAHVVPRSAAASAGIAATDAVIGIRGRRLEDFTSAIEVEAALSGPLGERIEVVVRDGAGRARTVVLAVEPRPTIDAVALEVRARGERRYLVVRVAVFEAGVAARTIAAIEGHLSTRRRRIAGLVFDLRQNPGGAVDEAVVLADHFLAQGLIARVRGRDGVIAREERAGGRAAETALPIVILVDESTASSAEIFAAALGENKRARLLGARTLGKGTVQLRAGLPDGSRLSVTTGHWFTPLDHRVEGRGLDPDRFSAARGDALVDEAIAWLDAGP